MSFPKTARAGVLALLAGAACMAAPLAAHAGTPACGTGCIGVYSSELGTAAQPNFVEHVWGGIARVGIPTGLTRASGADPSEDFINPHPGTVADYYQLGLVSADVNRHYGGLNASQLEYAPQGRRTGLCVGIPFFPFNGETLSLQPCTIPGRTVWIIGTTLSPATPGRFPIISGATWDFSHPFTMTYPRHPNTNWPLPPIWLQRLELEGGAIPPSQLWGVKLGPLV